MRLVIFLSRALPAIGIVAVTAFFYWGGMAALLCGKRIAAKAPDAACRARSYRRVARVVAAASNSRLLIMVPFLDTVSWF
jgi:hypothetical protein